MDKSVAIGIGILVLVGLGFLFVSNMTGNVITGRAVTGAVEVENEYFRISDFGSKLDEEVDDGLQSSGGSG